MNSFDRQPRCEGPRKDAPIYIKRCAGHPIDQADCDWTSAGRGGSSHPLSKTQMASVEAQRHTGPGRRSQTSTYGDRRFGLAA